MPERIIGSKAEPLHPFTQPVHEPQVACDDGDELLELGGLQFAAGHESIVDGDRAIEGDTSEVRSE